MKNLGVILKIILALAAGVVLGASYMFLNNINPEQFCDCAPCERALAEIIGDQSSESASRADNMGLERIVASKNGEKYYRENDPAAQKIKEENRLYFSSEAEAQAAGYEPSANFSATGGTK